MLEVTEVGPELGWLSEVCPQLIQHSVTGTMKGVAGLAESNFLSWTNCGEGFHVHLFSFDLFFFSIFITSVLILSWEEIVWMSDFMWSWGLSRETSFRWLMTSSHDSSFTSKTILLILVSFCFSLTWNLYPCLGLAKNELYVHWHFCNKVSLHVLFRFAVVIKFQLIHSFSPGLHIWEEFFTGLVELCLPVCRQGSLEDWYGAYFLCCNKCNVWSCR